MAGDANYANVSTLVHGSGANNGTVFADTAPVPKVWSAVGNACTKSTTLLGGTSALYFDGAGDYIQTPNHSDLALGSGDFTFDATVHLTAYPAANGGVYKSAVVNKDSGAFGGREYTLNMTGTATSFTGVEFTGFASDAVYVGATFNFAFALNTTYKLRVVRSGNLLYCFVDGVLINPGGSPFNVSIRNAATTLKIGASDYDATFKFYLTGYVAEVRITKGVARSTASYTPDASPFPDGMAQVTGIVRDDTNAPCARTVRAYRRDTGALAATVVSDAVSGAYSLYTPTLGEVNVVVLDDDAGTLQNDLIARVIPA